MSVQLRFDRTLLVAPELIVDEKIRGVAIAERKDAALASSLGGTVATSRVRAAGLADPLSPACFSTWSLDAPVNLLCVPWKLLGETTVELPLRAVFRNGSSARTGMVPATVAYTSNAATHLRSRSTAPTLRRHQENGAIAMKRNEEKKCGVLPPDVIQNYSLLSAICDRDLPWAQSTFFCGAQFRGVFTPCRPLGPTPSTLSLATRRAPQVRLRWRPGMGKLAGPTRTAKLTNNRQASQMNSCRSVIFFRFRYNDESFVERRRTPERKVYRPRAPLNDLDLTRKKRLSGISHGMFSCASRTSKSESKPVRFRQQWPRQRELALVAVGS
jgi:hypothetical protein